MHKIFALIAFSAVYLITLAISEESNEENPQYDVSVVFSGAGGASKKFCPSEIHINNASYPIRSSGVEACAANGIEFAEIKVTEDALTILVNSDDDQVDCLTFEQLYSLWKPDISIKIPDAIIKMWSNPTPRADSWSLNFTRLVAYPEGGPYPTDTLKHATIIPRSDDEIRYAMDHFGFAFYLEEVSKLRAVRVRQLLLALRCLMDLQ